VRLEKSKRPAWGKTRELPTRTKNPRGTPLRQTSFRNTSGLRQPSSCRFQECGDHAAAQYPRVAKKRAEPINMPDARGTAFSGNTPKRNHNNNRATRIGRLRKKRPAPGTHVRSAIRRGPDRGLLVDRGKSRPCANGRGPRDFSLKDAADYREAARKPTALRQCLE